MESLPHIPSLEEQEAIKNRIISFVKSKLEEAYLKFRENFKSENKKDFIQYLLENWQENDGVPWQRRPRFNIPETDIQIRFESQTNEYDSASKTMSLAIGRLRSAKTLEEFDIAFTHLMQSLHHEVEHVFHPGQELTGTDDIQEMIEYLCDEGEIRAYAREYSYRYSKEYPGESFDLSKMQTLALKLKDEGKPNAWNYFVIFADSKKQEKYGEYGDIAGTYEYILNLTSEMLNLWFLI